MSPSSGNRQQSPNKRPSTRVATRIANRTWMKSYSLRQHDIDARGEPHPCATNGCSKAARHRGSLCETHYADSLINKDVLPIIYQGCPRFLPPGNHDRIRWTQFRSRIATWINQNFDLSSPRSRPNRYPEMVLVLGWKSSERGLFIPKQLDGTP